MKHCPKCNRDWPDRGKFCPMDGTPLVEAGEDEGDRAAATVILSEEDLKKNVEEGGAADVGRAEPAESEVPGPGGEEEDGKEKTPQQFSETKWFMAGDHIKDEEVNAEDKPVDDLQDIYKKTRKLPPDVRKKFSLKYGTPDDDQGEGDNGKS